MFARLVACFAILGCKRVTIPDAGPKVATLTLDGQPVQLRLPNGVRLDEKNSDPGTGFAAFDEGRVWGARDLSLSAFLDGSRAATQPASLDEAVREVTAEHECERTGSCLVLTRETLVDGGFLVSVKSADRVFVRSWRTVGRGRKKVHAQTFPKIEQFDHAIVVHVFDTSK